MSKFKMSAFAFGIIVIFAAGCSFEQNPLSSSPSGLNGDELNGLLASSIYAEPVVLPTELVTVEFGAKSLTFWPYTGSDFSAQPQDPINLIFTGMSDPRDIRAALMSLGGDRTAFGLPNEAPFNSVWEDAIGDVQTAYSTGEDWAGSAIQLQCGGYGPVRLHLRLFRTGEWTVGNAHFELLIPGTTDHQVLSWEVAKQFVIVDMVRCGLLDPAQPMSVTGQINEPDFRTIPAVIYNLLPVELRAAINGPLADVIEDVPIGGDGAAAMFNVAAKPVRVAEVRVQDFVVPFDQVVPKPFCASGPYDYIKVLGDVHLYLETEQIENGKFRSVFRAEGALAVVPVNPLTGEIVGDPVEAVVREHHSSSINDSGFSAESWLFQKLVPASDPSAGSLFRRLKVSDKGPNGFEEVSPCR